MRTIVSVLIILLFFPLLSGCDGIESGRHISVSSWECIRGGDEAADPGKLGGEWAPFVTGLPLNGDLLPSGVLRDETIWLRGRFVLASRPRENYGVVVMGKDRNASIYINDVPLEKPVELRYSNIYSPVSYSVPVALLRKGPNTIHIKTHVRAGYTAVTENISIMDSLAFVRETMMHELVFTQLPLAILIFNFSLLFPPLIFFVWNRWARVLAYGSVVLMLFVLYIIFQFLPVRYAGALTPRVHLALIPIFGVFLFVAVQSLYRIYLSFFIRLIAAACLATSILIMVADMKITEIYSPFVLLAGIMSIVPLSIWILNMINTIKRDRLQFYMLVLLILAAGLAGGYEVVAFIFDIPFAFLSPIYGSPFFVIIFMVLASRELMRSTVKMELLYKTLGRPEKKDNGPIITDMTESKLKSVIDFINRNYAQDISREGLAGAIDISTDYMSRLFRKYTGKKINEYINELRIRDAIKKLDDGNLKIIDIALSVGFESLSTFNRAFKHVTGITPSRYRSLKEEAGSN